MGNEQLTVRDTPFVVEPMQVGLGSRTPTLRDIAGVIFRHRRLGLISFTACLLGAVVFIALTMRYESEMTLLVDHQRLDPLVSAQPSAPAQVSAQQPVTDADVNSEIQLIQSQDLLRETVLQLGLQKHAHVSLSRLWGSGDDNELRIAKAIEQLQSRLTIAQVPTTTLISVKYWSRDARQAQTVLNTLLALYLQKHLQVHHSAGQFQFFKTQTDKYHQQLAADEAQLTKFSQNGRAVSPHSELALDLQKMKEFQGSLYDTQAEIASTKDLIHALEREMGNVPERRLGEVKTAGNPELLDHLRSTLLDLQLQRTKLLANYTPQARPVKALDKQITEAQAALANAESHPMVDQSTDPDPTHTWIIGELAKQRSALKGLEAKADALSKSIAEYDVQSRALAGADQRQTDLERAVKADETNYLLYRQKAEEARITDALDQSRIINVAVAEQPTLPSLPQRSPLLLICAGMILALIIGAGAVMGAEYFDDVMATPAQVEALLQVPVLATLPQARTPQQLT